MYLKNGKIFKLIKFQFMDSRTDEEDILSPDDIRLPEAYNIIKGNMSIIGNAMIIGITKKLEFTRVLAV